MDLRILDKAMEGKTRIVNEWVPGKQVTLAHVIASPDEVVFEKLGLLPLGAEPGRDAVGVMTLWPAETSPIAANLVAHDSGATLAFVDRMCGTLIFFGKVADVRVGLQEVCDRLQKLLDFHVCPVTSS